MKSVNLQIEYIPVEQLKPYGRNARKHTKKDISAIAHSIEEFGFDDPIGIWSDENLIVEGHGRLQAAKKLGMQEVPCIRLDHLTDAERRAYALAHNRTAEISDWLDDILQDEMQSLEAFDFTQFGFDEIDKSETDTSEAEINVQVPQYQINGEMPSFDMMVDSTKCDDLISEINMSDIDSEAKEFLIKAAHRHEVFNYRNIAEYYAHASAEVQRLMEKSALVIIDVQDAVANGYAQLKKNVQNIIEG